VSRWQRPQLWKIIYRLALTTQADLYHFHDPELLLIAPWLQRVAARPTIYDIHEVYPDFIKVKDYMPVWLRYPIAWSFQVLEPSLASRLGGLIFSDDAIASQFHRINLPKITLFNFPSRFFVNQAAEKTSQITTRPPIILHLGGHERNRGTALMIKAFAQVLQSIPTARLFLVGHFMPPSLQNEVQMDIDQHNLEHAVKIIGRVPFDNIGEYLKQAAVGWVPWQPYPKNDKNIPTKLFEYMSYGVPIVSSDLNSTRPFIQNGENGFLVDANNPGAHAQAIIKIINEPQLAYRMGQKSKHLAATIYNWDSEEKKLESFYVTVLRSEQGSHPG
jgi:glycosyltransferase involved in cell wall biosynthesis